MAQQQPAQAPGPETGKLRGVPPDIFTGNRALSKTFKQQFDMYKSMNDNHEIMLTPYYHTVQALSLIKGPLVDDWVADQIADLNDKVTRQNNPVPRHQEQLWNDFIAEFNTAFTDTTKRQTAQ